MEVIASQSSWLDTWPKNLTESIKPIQGRLREVRYDKQNGTKSLCTARIFSINYPNDLSQNNSCSYSGRQKLTYNAENVKHILSTLDTANCYIESLYEGIDFNSNVTRARFDNELAKVSFSRK